MSAQANGPFNFLSCKVDSLTYALGHLVSRMVCADSPLLDSVRQRIKSVMSISGLHDLRPLMNTAMNDDLALDHVEAASESPALLEPLSGIRISCWVGGDERPEFLRQNDLLANIWRGHFSLMNLDQPGTSWWITPPFN